ncbi:MAG: hypothetical protein AAFR51_12530 [Pseudomonadota bacterium]
MKKILKYGLIGWLVLSVLTFPFYWPFIRMFWVFVPTVEKPDYELPASAYEARLQDLDYLSTVLRYDRSFSETATHSFTAKLEQMKTSAEAMSDAQFYLGLAEAMAFADNGHTSVSYRPQYTQFNTIGARLYEFDDGVYVVAAAPDKAETVGRRVIAVDGTPIAALQSDMSAYKGGNEDWRKLYSIFLIESPDLMAAAGKAASSDRMTLTFDAGAGASEQVSFDGVLAENPDDLPWRAAWHTLSPELSGFLADGGSHALGSDVARLPKYLTAPGEPLSYSLDQNGLYIRALAGFTAGDQSIGKAYKAMLAEYPKGSLDYLVVDFRLHDGGDYTKSMGFAKAAPKAVKEDGDVYIITGPNTFSAAIVTAAMLKYNAGDRAVIIGEQMGDREQFWAERGSSFQLPNSGYYINYATGYHDWENGCKGEPYCFTMNEMFEVPAGSLAPEVSLPQDFASYARGEDVVMEWIAAQR